MNTFMHGYIFIYLSLSFSLVRKFMCLCDCALVTAPLRFVTLYLPLIVTVPLWCVCNSSAS